MARAGGITALAGETQRQRDLLRQANASARSSPESARAGVLQYTPEEKAWDADKAALDLTRRRMAQVDHLTEAIRQAP